MTMIFELNVDSAHEAYYMTEVTNLFRMTSDLLLETE